MGHLKTTGVALAVALALLATATTASANSARLTLSEAGVSLSAGTIFGAAGSQNVLFTTPAGSIECDSLTNFADIIGRDETNGESTDRIEISETIGSIGDGPHGEESCPTGTGLGAATVFAEGLPWTLSVSSAGKAELKSKGSGAIFFDMEFSGGDVCTYTSTKLKGTNPATDNLKALTLQFSDQKLKADKGFDSATCPKSATVSLSFPIAGAEGPGFVEEEI